VHTAFGLTRTVHVVLVGRGRVARELVAMWQAQQEAFLQRELTLRLVAVAGSSTWRFDPNGLALDGALALTDAPPRPGDAEMVAQVASHRLTDVVLVDVSGAPLQPLHLAALQAGMHVVTANKVPLAGPLATYRELVDARDAARVRYGYETTFGAGLPVLHTLKELVATGDELRSVAGCFSGTLGFLCTRLDEGVALAEAVSEAAQLGYTEPDPRDDLSGRDVARKALIVARALGLALEPDDVVLEPFVEGLEQGLSVALAQQGPVLARRVAEARERGERLRYVARIEGGRAEVGLRSVPASGPLGSLVGPDNMLVFTTRRYDRYPLVIRGPGAGAEVTAAGVLGDLLRVIG
jgi:aspartokinase/homoserine dehydrogenase 1